VGGLGSDGTDGAVTRETDPEDVEAIAAIGQGFGEARGGASSEDFGFTFELAQGREDEELPGDERRDGIAG